MSPLAAEPFCQSKWNFRYSYSKLWAQDCDDLKQMNSHNYDYSDKTSKFPNNNIHFFLAQIDQSMEKP